MSRYIDADKLKQIIEKDTIIGLGWLEKEMLEQTISEQSTEDVAPVVYGKWMFREITETIEKGVKECKCSVCGFGENTFNGGLIPFFLKDCNYCPDCGAKMEGGNKNDIS